MSKTYFTISEQKQKVISFIKKHKDILGLDEKVNKNILGLDESGIGIYFKTRTKVSKVKDITDEYLDELEKASNEEFFGLVSKVQLKFGQNFYIFAGNCGEKRHLIVIWLPNVLNEVVTNEAIKITTDNAINDFCGYNSFANVIETHSSWYNMTPKRWEMFEAVFDFYDNTSLQTG